MMTTCPTDRIQVPESSFLPTAVGDADRRSLLYLLNFVLVGFERIRTSRLRPEVPFPGWLEHWEDENYLYLETRIPGDTSALEIDLNLHDGVISARIARQREEEESGEP
jgi:hypothetical protein